MLLVTLIALVLVIVGIVIITRGNLWAGVAIIAVGVLIFLLRDQINSESNTNMVIPMMIPMMSRRSSR